jgi:hypothetical protein
MTASLRSIMDRSGAESGRLGQNPHAIDCIMMPDLVDPNKRLRARALFAGVAVVGALLVAGGGWLWARHGAAVFFDLVSAGLAYCF